MDLFSSAVNVSFVGAMIVIIQTVKTMLARKGSRISSDTWKVVVLILGLPMAAIMQTMEGWPGETAAQVIMNFLVQCFNYSAAATLLYQTGKLTLTRITNNGKEKE